MTAKEGVKTLGLPIKEYSSLYQRPLATLIVCGLRQVQEPQRLRQSLRLDLLWSSGWLFRSSDVRRPGWCGFMQHISTDVNRSKSEVMLLPIVDLNPSDANCIYSMLVFIVGQARLLNVITPCVTFDQPLWLKAIEVCRGSGLDVFCGLGGFHMLMSYIGSIGKVMEGSGLEDSLEQCYGPNTVVHKLAGKAVARALRSYFLVAAVLEVLLVKQILSGTVGMDYKEQQILSDDDVCALCIERLVRWLLRRYHCR